MIPLLRPSIPTFSQVDHYFQDSRKEGMFTNFGPCFWEAFKFLSMVQGRPTLPVSNGTVAIQLAASVYFAKGSRVAVPDFTCVATLLAILRAGMHPVIFPCEKETWTLHLETLEQHKSTYDAIVVVSPFGYHVDVGTYRDFARLHNKRLMFDFAGAWPMTTPGLEPVCYSFHATKNLAIGEGGAVSFGTIPDWEKAKRLINFAFDENRETEDEAGINGKLDEYHCAAIRHHLGPGQSALIAKIEHKKSLIDMYQKQLPVVPHSLHRKGYPSVCVVAGLPAEKIEAQGRIEGIHFRRYYYPLITKMRGLQHIPRYGKTPAIFETCLGLPSDVDSDEFEAVVKFIKKHL